MKPFFINKRIIAKIVLEVSDKMKIFLTGATGFIGSRLVEKLLLENHDVVMLVRSISGELVKKSRRIKIIQGDLLDIDSIVCGMKECELAFHLAAYTLPWSKDPSLPFRINVTGTENVLKAALIAGIRRVIITSTAGTMGISKYGKSIDETVINNEGLFTEYEKNKAEAEKIVSDYFKKGLEIVIVNPTRVYGPGRLTVSNSVTKIIFMYLHGLWRIMPGNGSAVGNYVFIDDVVDGHLLAAKYGVAGERYILGGENLSFSGFFKTLEDIGGKKRIMIYLPAGFLKVLVRTLSFIFQLFHKYPVITEEWLRKYLSDSIVSSKKAEVNLGYKITPFREGAMKTIDWLKYTKKQVIKD